MTGTRGIWVGILDLDGGGEVAAVDGPIGPGHDRARVLVRLHGAPLGFVLTATAPVESLGARARAEAEARLTDAVRRHAELDGSPLADAGPEAWTARTGCPRRFPAAPGTGITLTVCTRDRTESLRGCLEAMRRVRHHPVEILVVDNAPTRDGTRELVTDLARTDARIRYTCEPRPGLSSARNHAFEHAGYDLVAFTDDDTFVDPGWPAALVAAFAADPDVVCVTGPVASCSLDTAAERYFDSRYLDEWTFEPCRFDLADHRRAVSLYPYNPGNFGTGANSAVRRSGIAGLPAFQPPLFDPLLGAGAPARGGEDLDTFLRLVLAGGRIGYVPAALVWHRYGGDHQALAREVYCYGQGLGAYLAKHAGRRDLRAGLLRHGAAITGRLVHRTNQTSRDNPPGTGGHKLATLETTGIVVGALRYWYAAHGRRHGYRPPMAAPGGT